MHNLLKWTKGLRLKLLMLAMIPIFALGIVSYVGISTALMLDREIYKANEVRAKLIEYTGNMEASIHAVVRHCWTLTNAKSNEEKKLAQDHLKKYLDNFESAKSEYLKIPRSKMMTDLFKNVENHWPQAKENAQSILNLAIANSPDLATKGIEIITQDLRPHTNAITEQIDEMQVKRREIMHAEVEALHKETEKEVFILIIISTLSGLTLFITSIIIAKNTTKKIQDVTETLSISSVDVTESAKKIAQASDQLSSATTEQAASLEETTSSLEEISAMITKASENASSTAISASTTKSKTEEGQKAVEQMIISMSEISVSNDLIMKQIDQSNQQMTEIIKVIHEIGTKTNVINDIVFQTKLLSFNASVEAARAGEHGKGFAVVAEEVGNLAQMSGTAAKEITDMLGASIEKVETIIEDTKKGVSHLIADGKLRVETGNEVAKQCANALGEILHNVNIVTSLSDEISNASREQSLGVQEINKAMGQLNTVTQQNSVGSEEAAKSAEHLSGLADNLTRAVQNLIATVDGTSS